jgi:hypothetical protein
MNVGQGTEDEKRRKKKEVAAMLSKKPKNKHSNKSQNGSFCY